MAAPASELGWVVHFVVRFTPLSPKFMHGMNQTEAEHPRRSKRSQTASLSQIGPVIGIGV